MNLINSNEEEDSPSYYRGVIQKSIWKEWLDWYLINEDIVGVDETILLVICE